MPSLTDPNHDKAVVKLFSLPQKWPHWPVLPVVRFDEDGRQVGVMVDLFHQHGVTGFSATVFLCYVLNLPTLVNEIACLSKEVYDQPEEVFLAGWRPDM